MNLLLWIASLENSVKTLFSYANKCKPSGDAQSLIAQRERYIKECVGVKAEIEFFYKYSMKELDRAIERSQTHINELADAVPKSA